MKTKVQYVVNNKGIGHNKALWIYKHRDVIYYVEILMKRLCDKGFHKRHKTQKCT